jgi:hypothetical protein
MPRAAQTVPRVRPASDTYSYTALRELCRLIRSAVVPTTARLPTLEDTSTPSELNSVLRERRNLENQVLLLIGSVGSENQLSSITSA